MRLSIALLFSLGILLRSGAACAGVGEAEAGRLGADLTPVGAERAGNREGTIPAYTGGLPADTSPPGFVKDSGRWVDPFPDEKPLVVITALNMAAHADRLGEASKELLRRHPTYRMHVYPSRRSVAWPAWTVANTRRNAATATLARDGLAVEGAFGGLPFPIPRNGCEVMWNHMLVCNGYPAEYHARNWYVGADGKAVNSGEIRCSLRSGYYDPARTAGEFRRNGSAFFEPAYDFVAPPRAAGNATYSIDTLDPVRQPRRAWSYSAATRTTRISPDLTYDTPIASQGGVTSYDEGYLFLGKLDRFEYRLVGKREMIIPYNNYRMVFQSGAARLLTPGHPDPDLVRWELHRVWVVEAALRPGARHALGRRTFFFDEDWSGAGMSDGYDHGGRLVKGIFLGATPLYDRRMPMARCYWAFDLRSGVYTVMQHFGDADLGYLLKPEGIPDRKFSPDALPDRGR